MTLPSIPDILIGKTPSQIPDRGMKQDTINVPVRRISPADQIHWSTSPWLTEQRLRHLASMK